MAIREKIMTTDAYQNPVLVRIRPAAVIIMRDSLIPRVLAVDDSAHKLALPGGTASIPILTTKALKQIEDKKDNLFGMLEGYGYWVPTELEHKGWREDMHCPEIEATLLAELYDENGIYPTKDLTRKILLETRSERITEPDHRTFLDNLARRISSKKRKSVRRAYVRSLTPFVSHKGEAPVVYYEKKDSGVLISPIYYVDIKGPKSYIERRTPERAREKGERETTMARFFSADSLYRTNIGGNISSEVVPVSGGLRKETHLSLAYIAHIIHERAKSIIIERPSREELARKL